MSTIYINTRQSEEHRIIIVKNGVLTGYEQDVVGWENIKGDIYKAVVTRIEEGLDAAFVNFGESKNGFLPLKHVAEDMPGASGGKHKIAEGDSILVQIKKDHVGDKGAGLTTNISLAGCYLVLMPDHKRTLMSKNIDSRDRQKVNAALSELNVPEGMGLIVRTAGIGREVEDLRWDLEGYLLKLWRAIEEAARNNRGPLLIYRENNLILRVVRDHYRPGEDQIYCDDPGTYEELKGFMAIISPDNVDCIHYHHGGESVVPESIEEQIDTIYKREIKTPSGARVVFDSTEAMVAIDINSAQIRGDADIEATALRTNMEAAEAIARHLRLRDLGGLIVVDFIDMTIEKNQRRLEEYFVQLLRKDRARVQWSGLSRFGLIELSRQRLSRPVEEVQGVVCKTCHGTGRQRRTELFALRLLRQIRRHLRGFDTGALVVQAPSAAAVYLLNEKRIELRRLEDEHKCEILIVPSDDIHPPDFNIRKIKNDKPISASYQMTPASPNTSVDVKKRFEKRNTARPKALISTVLPEERPSESWLTKLWKMLFGKRQPAVSKKTVHRKRGRRARKTAAASPTVAAKTAANKANTVKAMAKAAANKAVANDGGEEQTPKSRTSRRRGSRRNKSRTEAKATTAVSESAKTAANSSPPQSPTAAESSQLLLLTQLMEQYQSSEEMIRAAMEAIGKAAEVDKYEEITPQLAAQLDAYFSNLYPESQREPDSAADVDLTPQDSAAMDLQDSTTKDSTADNLETAQLAPDNSNSPDSPDSPDSMTKDSAADSKTPTLEESIPLREMSDNGAIAPTENVAPAAAEEPLIMVETVADDGDRAAELRQNTHELATKPDAVRAQIPTESASLKQIETAKDY